MASDDAQVGNASPNTTEASKIPSDITGDELRDHVTTNITGDGAALDRMKSDVERIASLTTLSVSRRGAMIRAVLYNTVRTVNEDIRRLTKTPTASRRKG